MVSKLLVTILLLSVSVPVMSQPQQFSGIVEDAESNQPLPGATIFLPELNLSAVTDSQGNFTFSNTPSGQYIIEIRFLGYTPFIKSLSLTTEKPQVFKLEPAMVEAETVVVTGSFRSSENSRNSLIVESVPHTSLISRPATNLVDALSAAGGVAQITTGPAVSKPVIRGLSYNRIITLNNGIKQEGQQWGDEHGIEIDQFSAGRVEILRGAASLMYGSDAIGGVINIIDPVPPAPGNLDGEILSQYSFNNGLSSNSAMVSGNTNRFVWRARGTYKNAFSYKTPKERIANTGFNEANFNMQAGLYKSWGHSKIDVSQFNASIGLPEFVTDTLDDGIGHTQSISTSNATDRKLRLPFQKVQHTTIGWNNYIILGKGHLRTLLAYQQNRRREFESENSKPELSMELNTFSTNLKYFLPERQNWQPVIGVSGAAQENSNNAEERLIPDYTSEEAAIFGYVKKEWSRYTFNLGLRYDFRRLKSAGREQNVIDNRVSHGTMAAGATMQLSRYVTLKANTGTAFRAPNIAELASNGVHEGAFRYEIGNPELKPEKSYYADAAILLGTNRIAASASLYLNLIDNYIFLQPGDDYFSLDDKHFAVYYYNQAGAILYGSEVSVKYHPVKLLHIENSFYFTKGENRTTRNSLPFIPAARMKNSVSVEPHLKWKNISESNLGIEVENAFAQNNPGLFESATPGYTLVNITAGLSLTLKNHQELRLTVYIDNLFDTSYIDHLSRLKTQGVLNSGRNVGIGLAYTL